MKDSAEVWDSLTEEERRELFIRMYRFMEIDAPVELLILEISSVRG